VYWEPGLVVKATELWPSGVDGACNYGVWWVKLRFACNHEQVWMFEDGRDLLPDILRVAWCSWAEPEAASPREIE
jgi:hypothetical protein